MTELEYVEESVEPVRRPGWGRFLGVAALLIAVIWGMNFWAVGQPVAKAIGDDARNSGFSLSAHYRWYVDPTTLIIDLSRLESASPLDLFRGLLQSSGQLSARGRKFERVILARNGTPVFIMLGKEFEELGRAFGAGENPIFLVRTLPEKLYRPNGDPAFGHWEGGLLGVLGKQMQDATTAAKEWSGNSE